MRASASPSSASVHLLQDPQASLLPVFKFLRQWAHSLHFDYDFVKNQVFSDSIFCSVTSLAIFGGFRLMCYLKLMLRLLATEILMRAKENCEL
jgi:hypothetical protein